MAHALELLDQPARRSARLVALALLAEAASARDRLGGSDADALHDFRVAVRRLRSWLRSLDPWLDESVPKKTVRRLAKAARATGRSRDAEVHLEWLAAQRLTLNARQRYGVDWLIEHLQAERQDDDALVGTKATRLFDRARAKLVSTLPEYTARVDQGETEESLAAVMGNLVRQRAERLAERLGRVESFDQARRVHRARIAAKRLRYLIEPIAEAVPHAPALVAELASLQTTLGDCHDVHVFSTTIVDASGRAGAAETRRTSKLVFEGDEISHAIRAGSDKRVTRGLLALAGRLHERGEVAFALARESWLGGGADLLIRAEAVAAAVERRPPQHSSEARRSGDRTDSEQMEKELDEQHRGNGRRENPRDDASEAHEPRAKSRRGRPVEEPAVREAPRT